MVDFTVVIPTYNGAQRLPRVLDALRSQIITDLTWEILVVDNNSTDTTAAVVKQYQSNWLDAVPLRSVTESRQGLAYARQCGVETADGLWVGFLDDDTAPDQNWVMAAYGFGEQHPRAGAYGGQIHGEFEVPPPENFERIKSFLAIKERGPEPHLYQPEVLILPPGAGLVIRKQAWLEAVPAQLQRTTRGGNDFEISICMHRQGWEIWYNPEMHIYHHIPKKRLEREALISLSRTVGSCICELRLINVSTLQKPVIVSRILVGNLRRVIQHVLTYRMQIKHDVVLMCELVFFIAGFMSPFYLLKKTLVNTTLFSTLSQATAQGQ
ncbi:glycosyl transferase [Leptolyngbya sp. Heron Island J]|uniref:hormogonium polysaccharide biosynthesis glycosyltransferase HpsE n=1 Tax=Leptolyngbya sp. Heron Island J TaxID=1385935 RepID=UPI0003B9447F|nr:hormogonium polysaccharide biosynthesis glycosyltransferase HpsE [Leptolyngbya sp. Heron Island J]ESA36049.1 glycosyl transferase [Leptolyngbya sp. Heron Island J]